MSDPVTPSNPSPPAPAHAATDPEDRHPHSLVIRVWPNIPILYPMAIAALLCGIFSLLWGVDGTLRKISKPQDSITQTVNGQTTTVAADDVQVSVKASEVAAELKVEQVIALI